VSSERQRQRDTTQRTQREIRSSANTPAALTTTTTCHSYTIHHPVEPQSLLGRRVSVKWDDADAWFNGVVSSWCADTCTHQASRRG
jgi:hypothetical protein